MSLIGSSLSAAPNVTAWGVNGKPNDTEYAVWDGVRTAKTLDYVKEVGANWYRIAFTVSNSGGTNGNGDPAILGRPGSGSTKGLVQLAGERDLKVLLIVWPKFTTTNTAPKSVYQFNYDDNYQKGYAWAIEAIKAGRVNGVWTHKVTHFELGNELSYAKNASGTRYFTLQGGTNGSLIGHWSEGVPGARQAYAGALHGLYWGIKGAFVAAKDLTKFNPRLIPNTDPIVPTLLYGEHWMHFGFLNYLHQTPNLATNQAYNFLPADIISWHWYSSYGTFANGQNSSNPAVPIASSPISYLYAWNKDIWLTEFGRTRRVESPAGSGTWYDCGGSMNWFTDQAVDNRWDLQANEVAPMLNNFTGATGDPQRRVKGIFAYELYDWHLTKNAGNAALRSSQGYYGLVHLPSSTTFQYKNAFNSYKNWIASYKAANP